MTSSNRQWLAEIAARVMRERGLEPTFGQAATAEANAMPGPATAADEPARDLRQLLWCSIDNDDSRDLDQLSVAEPLANGAVRVIVAVADVDSLVTRGSAIDRHAAANTTSVYTPAMVFPMLPERLSTDLTSLNEDRDRLAIAVEIVVNGGQLQESNVFGALVRNKAKLAYNAVGAWLTGQGPLPAAAASVPGMDEQLRVQDRVAQALARARHEQGALEFETTEVRPEFEGDKLDSLTPEVPNRAKALIENLMVAANGVVARFLDSRGSPSIRRVVRTPKRWDRIVALAAESGDRLPEAPDAHALNDYLVARRAADPERFPDLSQAIIRLLGSGEYVVDTPGSDPPGHFGLAVRDYAHSTAPNRRFPDLLTQRLVKAVLSGKGSPYSVGELEGLAAHCTLQEDNANKVERQLRKSASALLVASRIGQKFDALVTGASYKGTWVRVANPPIEGKLVEGDKGLDVGDHLRVRLMSVDVERGFIDFAAARS